MENNHTYFIKLQGKANIPVPLHIGHNFKVTSDCSITQEQKDDNEDGGYDITYKAVPVTVEIGVDNGPTVRARDPRRNSQKIRNMLWKVWFNEGSLDDFDAIYDEATYVILSMMPAIFREASKRIEDRKK
jgi:hypothetical protein